MSEHIVSFDIKRTLGGYLEMMAFMQDLYGRGMLHEQIIRCRDCERWSNEPPNYREEPQWCGRFACHAEPDGFCKWAKPRGNQ